MPYGPKPIAEVRAYALDCLDRLVDDGVKVLVIACNSASAACLHDARERYSVPVVEVIRPAVRRAVAATRNGRVGVIGTTATITSGAYVDAFAAAPQVNVTGVACPPVRGLRGARHHLGPGTARPGAVLSGAAQRAEVDTLVLGCTHYPLLAGLIGLVMGDAVTLVSSADETAQGGLPGADRAATCCVTDPEPPEHRFLATGDQAPFTRLAQRFLGPIGAGDRLRADVGGRSRERSMRLTVLGCAGSFPGPDSAVLLLSRARPTGSGCCSTSAPARCPRCSGTRH